MKSLYTIFLVLLLTSLTLSQTDEQIMLEAYPQEPTEQPITPAAIAWENLIYAKKSGDVQLYQYYLGILKNEFPEVLKSNTDPVNPVIENRNFSSNVITSVYEGNLYTGGTETKAGGNPKTIRVRSDSAGAQYVAFINLTRDSLMVYKSVDHGATWLNLQSFTLAGGALWQGVDFNIADSANTVKLGFAATATSTNTTLDGTLYFIIMNNDGSGFRWSVVDVPAGRGMINPAIVSDAYYYEPAVTHWFIGYQDYSISTATNNPVKAAVTPDWGTSWNIAIARTGYNDYDVDIDINYFPTGDTLYCLLSNNLTLTNPNLRIRKILLSAFGGTWSQYNPATSTAPEYYGSMSVNRQTGDMIVSYTIVNSGNQNVGCTFTNKKEGKYFQGNFFVADNAHAESSPTVDCHPYDGVYRIVYQTSGGTHDTVIYKSAPDLNSGSFTKTVAVNPEHNASSLFFADVSGYDVNTYGTNGFVVFAGSTSGLYHTYSDIIPVELVSFKVVISGNSALLNWSTATETNNSGFAVEYRRGTDPWIDSGFLEGKGTTSEPQDYSFTVNGLNSGFYSFRLRQTDYDGTITYSKEIETEVTGDVAFELHQNYPNPFNPSTELTYSVKERGLVNIKVYDMLGSLITTLINEVKEPGMHSVKFDGSSLASGVYMYSISVNEFNAVRKMILSK
jgi:hypothetical protein